MAQSQVSKLQVYSADRIQAGLLEENNIVKLYAQEPVKMDTVVSAALAQSDARFILEAITDTIGNVEKADITNSEFEWDLILKSDLSYPVAKTTETSSTPGIKGSTFTIGFPEKCFSVNDNVIAEDHELMIKVVNEPYQDGTIWIYTFKLVNPNISFFTPSEFGIGKRFTRVYTQVATEFSDKGGVPQLHRPIKLRNRLNTLRLQYSVSRSVATNEATVIELRNPMNPNETTKLWAKAMDWAAMKQWRMDRNYCDYASIGNQPITGLQGLFYDENGRTILQGAGFEDQVSPSNIFEHNGSLTFSQLEEWVTDLSFQCSYYGGDCDLALLCGWGLKKLIDNAMLREFNGTIPSNYLINEAQFLTGKGDALTYTSPQFSTIIFRNGITLKLINFALFNDQTYYKKMFRGYTRKSYEGVFFNLKTANGKVNLKRVYKKNSENKVWEVTGSTDSTGQTPKYSSSGKDGYDVHMLTEQNIVLLDPLASGRILLKTA